MPTTANLNTNLENALITYKHRQSRAQHSQGQFDNAGRWYPSQDEKQPCCKYIREPSRAYPNSLNQHCRSIEHVAALYGVDPKELRKCAKIAFTGNLPFTSATA